MGAVLAGGRSTRFGSDKAQAVWNGTPLIEHVAARLATIASSIIVCGRDHPGIASIPDRPALDLGPLGALNAALHHAQERKLPIVITAPCDTPLLDETLLAALAGGEGDTFLITLPVIGRWRSASAVQLEEYLMSGRNRSMRAWSERIGARPLDHPPPPNINGPDDLEALNAYMPRARR